MISKRAFAAGMVVLGLASASMASTVKYYADDALLTNGNDSIHFDSETDASHLDTLNFGPAGGSATVDLGLLYAVNGIGAPSWNNTPFSIAIHQKLPSIQDGTFDGTLTGNVTVIGSDVFIHWTNTAITLTGTPDVSYVLQVGALTHVPLYLPGTELQATISVAPIAAAVPLPASLAGGTVLLGALGLARHVRSPRRA